MANKAIKFDNFTDIITKLGQKLLKRSEAVQCSTLGVDDSPTSGSDNLVKSGGVKAVTDALGERVDNLENIGRYLAIWNCTTGLPTSNPPSSPYAYKSGDYYRVGAVASGSGVNYIPSGSSYTAGVASATPATEAISVGDIFWYDGSVWAKQSSSGGGTVQDVQIDGTSILAGGIANIPHASSSAAGVHKVSSSYGVRVTGGMMVSEGKTLAEYLAANGLMFVGKTTLENVLTGETVRFDAAQTLDAAQKAQARSNIGAGTPLDVQVEGVSKVVNGVANIGKAGSGVLGVVMPGSGLNISNTGSLFVNRSSGSAIEGKAEAYNPIVPANLDKAVKEGLGNYNMGTNDANAWSAAYKSHARDVIGAFGMAEYDAQATSFEGNVIYYVVD